MRRLSPLESDKFASCVRAALAGIAQWRMLAKNRARDRWLPVSSIPTCQAFCPELPFHHRRPQVFDLITPVSYWILIVLWLVILWLYLAKLRESRAVGGAVAVLLLILAIDAFRTLFESVYFGLYFNSLFGMMPKSIHDVLSRPAWVIVPKLVNVIAGLLVLFLLIRRWIPREVREREEWINHLQEKDEQFSVLLEKSPLAIRITKDRGKTLVYTNPAYKEVMASLAMPGAGGDPSQYYTEASEYEEIIEELEQGRAIHNRLVKLSAGDGSKNWYLASYAPIQYRGEPASLGWFFDITDRKEAEEALRESEKKYRDLLDTDPDGMVIVNGDGKIEVANQQLQKMTGYRSADLIGAPVEKLVPKRFSGHKQQRERFTASPRVRFMGEGAALFVRRKDGTEFPAEISLNPLDTADGLNISASIRDITQRKQADEQLSYQASHDALTGLVNRREFERRTARLLASDRYEGNQHALCFMDLDQFKVVNDTCGHTAGDEMLRQLGSLLIDIVRHRDTLARLGGDEFGVLMEHCSLDEAHRVTAVILNAIQNYQFVWEGRSFKIGVSMGLVPITADTTNLTDLLKDADAACYMAKDRGRNQIHVYEPGDAAMAQRHGEMQWVTRLDHALQENRFCLYAQAIVPLDAHGGMHYELLIRMIDESGETIPPGAFLPAAERYHLISRIDYWVIQNAFTALTENPDFLKRIDSIAINLSGQSLGNEDFLNYVVTKLQDTGIAGSKLCFEITETAAISNLNTAAIFISSLKELGCRFALDDFGSGLSSFAYLKTLPVDYLKIDGMFVRDIAEDPIDHAMVKSINEIGQVMGMQTIAEFVENDAIKVMLKEIGVNYGQGYGIDKPRPFGELLQP
jgi:diguanylate cyclase (GGDEF)-like protein/PAS domain S-box-containing protein